MSFYVRLMVFIILVFIAFILAQKNKKDAKLLDENGRYIIGTTEGWVHNHRSSDYALDYSYTVNGVIYKTFMYLDNISGIETKKGKYLVRFYPPNPRISKILLNYKVIANPGNYKNTGWVRILETIVSHYEKPDNPN